MKLNTSDDFLSVVALPLQGDNWYSQADRKQNHYSLKQF